MTSAQLRRQDAVMAGYLCPRGAVFELGQGQGRSLGVGGPIDGLERRGNRLAILPAGVLHGITQQVHDAGLHPRLREYRVDRVGEALEAVDYGNQHVADAADFSSVMTRIQNLAPSVCSIQIPSTSLRPAGVTLMAR